MTETKLSIIARFFLVIIYLVGLVGISVNSLRPMYVYLTPITLLISAMILLAFHEPWNRKFLFSVLIIFLGSFLIEYLGASTGAVFGNYEYQETLGLKLFNVPLVIGINWLLVVYSSYYIASYLVKNKYLRLLAGGGLLLVFDLLLEPVAVKLDMWSWGGGEVPVQNYLAWFIIGIAFMSLFVVLKLKLNNKVAGYLYFIMVGFFGMLNLTL
ncbi:MAG: carotenoid biosynthesis protein [Bacteroidales bacterium]